MYNVGPLNLGHETLRELGVLSGQGQRFPCIVLIGVMAMAPHSGTLVWKIPWMEEPGRLQSMGLLRVGRD